MAEQDNMPPDNFFERDIAPLRNNFNLTREETSFIGALEDQRMAPQLQMQMKLRSQLLQERNADLAYQSSLFEFEERKRKAQEQIDFADKAEVVTRDLNNIVNDNTKSVFEKQQAVATYGIQNAQLISKIPSAGIMLRSAESSLKSQAAQTDAADKQSGTLFQVAQTGAMTPEQFSEEVNADGIVTDRERILERMNKSIFDKNKARSDAATAAAGAKADADFDATVRRQLTEDLSGLDDLAAYVKSVAEGMPEQGMDEDAETFASSKTKYESGQLEGIGLPEGINTVQAAQKYILQQRNKLRLQSKTRTRADDPDGAGGDMTDPID